MTDRNHTNRRLVLVIVCVAQFLVVLGLIRRADVAPIDSEETVVVPV
jgi:hypothetical protein